LIVAILEVAYSCNVKCQFCYNPWRGSHGNRYTQARTLPKSGFIKIIEKLKEWGVDSLAFSGGEPLLNKDIFEIAAHSKELGFKNSLLTNGLLVERCAEQIAESFDVVQVSLHGTEQTHDRLTGRKGAFHEVLTGRLALMEYDTPVSSVIVVNRLNLPGLRDTIALAGAMDMRSVLVNRFLPGGKGLENSRTLSLNAKELVEMLNLVEEACQEYGVPPFVGTPTPPCLEGLGDYSFLLKDGCVAGKGLHCAIDPSGGLRVCNHSPTVLGNCLKSDPRTIYETSEYVKGFSKLLYSPEMCKGCSKIDKCKGGCREAAHVMFGSIKAPDPIFLC
jgi:radical SAM protein with 4Fe4S-binding SPASM domain